MPAGGDPHGGEEVGELLEAVALDRVYSMTTFRTSAQDVGSLRRMMSYSAPSTSILTIWTRPPALFTASSNVVAGTVTSSPRPSGAVSPLWPLASPLSTNVNEPTSPAIALACTVIREPSPLPSTLRDT